MKRRHGFHWPVALAAVTFAIAPVAVGGGSSERDAHHDRFFDRVTRFFSRARSTPSLRDLATVNGRFPHADKIYAQTGAFEDNSIQNDTGTQKRKNGEHWRGCFSTCSIRPGRRPSLHSLTRSRSVCSRRRENHFSYNPFRIEGQEVCIAKIPDSGQTHLPQSLCTSDARKPG
jgi:hypothetical protein